MQRAGCSRPAVEQGGKCSEHRAGERAAGAPLVIVDGSGKGAHPYAPKPAEIYLALFAEPGVLKIGKATPWTVRSGVKHAADNLRIRQEDTDIELPIAGGPAAWTICLSNGEPLLWAESERVEHAAAGRLAHNVGAKSVSYTKGKEWLHHDCVSDVDWPNEFRRAVQETLAFFGQDEADAGRPRLVE